MSLDFATVWEAVSDEVPDCVALIHGGRRLRWRDFEQEAAVLAAGFANLGAGEGTRIAVCMENRPEYVLAHFAAYKIRAVPININFRYKASEVAYVCDNAEVELAVCESKYLSLFDELLTRNGKLQSVITTEAGSSLPRGVVEWGRLCSMQTALPRIARNEQDGYMLYTGGTTGLPKGVVYRNGDVSRGLMYVGCQTRDVEVPASIEDVRLLTRQMGARSDRPVSLVCPPLIHGTGMWLGTSAPLALGGTVVTLDATSFDPEHALGVIRDCRVTDLTIVGDAFARPLVQALQRMPRDSATSTLSSLRFIHSSGAMWSAEVKGALLEFGDLVLIDYLGSSEGSMGKMVTTRSTSSETAKFRLNENVRVLDDDGQDVVPGSGTAGMLAISGIIPVGYYKDSEKSAATFREIGGVRYSIPGDYARVEGDGTITLLGRGNHCINTGGEKVFPEEVEEAFKRLEGVQDCAVVGLPHDRFGQQVAAVIAPKPGHQVVLEELEQQVRVDLAGYKIPRQVVLVPSVQRLVNGKVDYAWARGQF